MPVNTAIKRRSASGVPFLPLGPSVPMAVPPAMTRQAAGWGYVGIPVRPVRTGPFRAAVWLAEAPNTGWVAGDS